MAWRVSTRSQSLICSSCHPGRDAQRNQADLAHVREQFGAFPVSCGWFSVDLHLVRGRRAMQEVLGSGHDTPAAACGRLLGDGVRLPFVAHGWLPAAAD